MKLCKKGQPEKKDDLGARDSCEKQKLTNLKLSKVPSGSLFVRFDVFFEVFLGL